jgi:anti-sigma factor RsiW
MRGRERDERIQELLDGLLGPAEEACVRALVEQDPEWKRDHRDALLVRELLDTPLDVAPPAELAPSILKAVTTDRVRQAFRFRLPAPLENGLALAGAAGLALAVLVGTRTVDADGLGWLGRGIVAATDGLLAFLDQLGTLAVSVGHLEWLARVLTTLSQAGGTVLATWAEPLAGLALIGGATTVALAVALKRTGSGPQRGGWSHAHLVA